MEINEKDLSKVAGGKLEAVETKDGKFVLIPEGCEHFGSLDDANKKIEEIEKCRDKCHHGPHGHHGHHGHHGCCGGHGHGHHAPGEQH